MPTWINTGRTIINLDNVQAYDVEEHTNGERTVTIRLGGGVVVRLMNDAADRWCTRLADLQGAF